MSTLTISILALVAVVVGIVVLFNLWQARAHRRLADTAMRRQSAIFGDDGGDSEQLPAAVRIAAERSLDTGRRWQPGADQNAWARERREPTFSVDDARSLADAESGGSRMPARQDPFSRRADAGLSAQISEVPPFDDTRPLRAVTPDDDDDGQPDREPPSPATRPLPVGRFAPDHRPEARPGNVSATSADTTADTSAETVDGRATAPLAVAGLAAPAAVEPATGSDPSADRAGTDATADVGAVPVAGVEADESGTAALPQAVVEQVVTLVPATRVNAERLIALTSSLRHVGSKAIRIEAEGGDGRWGPLKSGARVRQLRCSLLLANRQGPLNAVELSDFSASMESLADQIHATFAPPDMNSVLRAARALDATAARLDTQIDLGVELGEPIGAAQLAAIARKLDLFDRGAGRHACFAESGELLFTMGPGPSADRIAFVLDVPRTAAAHDAWRGMVNCASACAQRLGGRMIDGAGRGLSVGMIDTVGRQLAQRYQELADAGLAAGSPAALRVFS